ncbi:YkgB family protein [Geodermatophilus sp. SYSU D00708]
MATSHKAHPAGTALRLERVGSAVVRYGLALVLVWIGALKFASYEAAAIEGLVANSPVLSWTYRLGSVPTVAALIGVAEILLGCLIAARPLAPRVSAAGSLGAVLMFLTTLSFLLTTPGVWQPDLGFPFLSGAGQFLVKDVILLGAAIWTAGESLAAAPARTRPR